MAFVYWTTRSITKIKTLFRKVNIFHHCIILDSGIKASLWVYYWGDSNLEHGGIKDLEASFHTWYVMILALERLSNVSPSLHLTLFEKNKKTPLISIHQIQWHALLCHHGLYTHTHPFTHTHIAQLLSNSTFDMKLNCFNKIKNTMFRHAN